MNAEGTGSAHHMALKSYTTSGFDRTFLAHLVMPYEHPSTITNMTDTAYGAKVALPFRIRGDFTASITAVDTTWVDSTVSFSDAGADGGGTNTYLWVFGDGDSSTTAAPTHAFDEPDTYLITLTKTYQYHDEIQAVDTHSVLVAEALVADSIHGFYPDPADHTIQPEQSCSWEAHHHGGLGSTSYQWQWRTRGWWTNLDSSKIQEIDDVGQDNFQLRFIVTRGTQADTVSALSVTVDESGQYCTAK